MLQIVGGLAIFGFIVLLSIFCKKKYGPEYKGMSSTKKELGRESISECRCRTKNILRQWEQEAQDSRPE